MAARYNRSHLDLCREKIKTSQLLNRLQDNALAEKEFLTAGQIRSIEIALKKVLPDLASVDHSGEIATKRANELSDDELAAIAARSGNGVAEAPVDPSQLN